MIQIEKLDRRQIIELHKITNHEFNCALRQCPNMGESVKLKNLGVHKKVYSQAEVQKILACVEIKRQSKSKKQNLVDLSFIVKEPSAESAPKKFCNDDFEKIAEQTRLEAIKRYAPRVEAYKKEQLRNGTI